MSRNDAVGLFCDSRGTVAEEGCPADCEDFGGGMGLGGVSPSFRTSREVFGAIGAEALEDVARDREGAAQISESLATVGSWE